MPLRVRAEATGVYALALAVDGVVVPGGHYMAPSDSTHIYGPYVQPLLLDVRPAASSARVSRLEMSAGAGLGGGAGGWAGIAGERALFVLHVLDRFGNPVEVGGEHVAATAAAYTPGPREARNFAIIFFGEKHAKKLRSFAYKTRKLPLCK